MVSRKETKGKVTDDKIVNMSEIFKPHEECEKPRIVLIEGKPGMGKTTYCKKMVYDWATGKQGAEDCFPRFQIVLLLKCRDMKSNLREAIDDQLLPRDVEEDVKKRFFKFICQKQSNVLLILDGLDEVPTSEFEVFTEICEKRVLSESHVVATARRGHTIKSREYCDTLLQIEGFTEEDATEFIMKYFKDREKLAEKLLSKLRRDKNLKDMTANPLHTALLCLICEDPQDVLPRTNTQLYEEMIHGILRRYRKRKRLPETSGDLVKTYSAQLEHLGRIAWNGLLKGNSVFEESELKSHADLDELPEFGFLSLKICDSKLRFRREYSFVHKSFQECFAAFYLCCQLGKNEIIVKTLPADRRYFKELKEVVSFTCGMVAARCEKTAEAVIKRITVQVDDSKCFRTLLRFISECRGGGSKFAVKMARSSFESLKLQNLGVSLAESLKLNSSLNGLFLDNNVDPSIRHHSATGFAEVLKKNSSLTVLHLHRNRIDDQGANGLAEALEVNSTLTELGLEYNEISGEGAIALAKALKVNSTLTKLHLGNNGDRFGDQGANGLAEALEKNSTLTELRLGNNGIGDIGVTRLAEALKVNSSLTELGLEYNKFLGKGVIVLAKALEGNSTLTKLRLSNKDLCFYKEGVTDLVEALKVNSSLTDLGLEGNHIFTRDALACLAKALKENTTLTLLRLGNNRIGDQGATCLAEALEENSTLTELRLDQNGIGHVGATSLAEALKMNSSLGRLNLRLNNVGEMAVSELRSLEHDGRVIML